MSFANLPPLHFLPSVESAARLGSFRAAAEELCLTPSAISQQIHAVESALGARLFVRQGRSVMLTPEGRSYCQEVRRVLLELADAGRRLASRSNEGLLRISTVGFLAHEFLIPRLPSFAQRFPGIELRIETTMRPVQLQTAQIDAALRVRARRDASLATEPIGPVVATPVCDRRAAKRLAAGGLLSKETLIEMRTVTDGSWATTLRAQGLAADELRILSFDSYFETLTAAERGLGVAFGLFPMTTEWVRQKRLAVPFATRVPVEGGVSFVFRPHHPQRALLTEVAAWLRQQYIALAPLPDGTVI